jgi:hypothetical protein
MAYCLEPRYKRPHGQSKDSIKTNLVNLEHVDISLFETTDESVQWCSRVATVMT